MRWKYNKLPQPKNYTVTSSPNAEREVDTPTENLVKCYSKKETRLCGMSNEPQQPTIYNVESVQTLREMDTPDENLKLRCRLHHYLPGIQSNSSMI